MKKIRTVGMSQALALLTLGFGLIGNAKAYDRCKYISENLEGSYTVTFVKPDGRKWRAGIVQFYETNRAYTFNASNLASIGEIFLPGDPKQVKLVPADDDCLFVGLARIEDTVLGAITEGEDMNAFSVGVDYEGIQSIVFTKH
jgi:hypothetical protein